MQEFGSLRTAARKKRDAAIRKARDEYAETLRRIAELEQDILGRDPSSHRSISSCIESVSPSDRTFTTVDIMAGLEALDSGRVWRKRSVDNHISRLRDRGILRRLRKSRNTEPAVYVRADVETEPLAFEDMTLPQVVEAMLSERPLTQTELVVAMLEGGYETSMVHKTLRDAVGVALRGDPKRFKSDGRKWIALR